MSTQLGTDNPYHFTIKLEIFPIDPYDADPALADGIGRDTVDALRNAGYSIEPVYEGLRGGNQILIQVITFLENVPAEVWADRDTLGLISSLCTIFGSVIAIARYMFSSYKKRLGGSATNQPSLIKISAEIDGASLTIEAHDLESAKGAVNLAKNFYERYPTVAAKVTQQSSIKIKGSVPKKQLRKRR